MQLKGKPWHPHTAAMAQPNRDGAAEPDSSNAAPSSR